MVIYEPRGKAREYSPFAVNHYKGCTHDCKYCYVPRMMKVFNKNYCHEEVETRDILLNLERELKKKNIKEQVFLSFTTDPYNHQEPVEKITSKILDLFIKYNVPVAILSKGGKRILNDLEKFKLLNIKIGQTITVSDEKKLKQIERNASSFSERIEVFKILKENNIKTFVSIEPLFDSNELKNIVKCTLPYVDEYMIGLLSGRMIESNVNVNDINEQLQILRNVNKKIYVKESCRNLEGIKYVKGEEDDMNKYVLIKKENTLF